MKAPKKRWETLYIGIAVAEGAQAVRQERGHNAEGVMLGSGLPPESRRSEIIPA